MFLAMVRSVRVFVAVALACGVVSVPAVQAHTPDSRCTRFHIALPNDSWFGLAARFNLSRAVLLRLNGATLSTPLFVGNRVCLGLRSSGESSSAGASSGNGGTTTSRTTTTTTTTTTTVASGPIAPVVTIAEPVACRPIQVSWRGASPDTGLYSLQWVRVSPTGTYDFNTYTMFNVRGTSTALPDWMVAGATYAIRVFAMHPDWDGVWHSTQNVTPHSQIATFSIPNCTTTSSTTPSTPPVFSSAEVSSAGNQVTLTYDKTLSSTTAAISAFRVTVAGLPKGVFMVGVSGSTVSLVLSGTPVLAGQVVTVAYIDPTAGDDTNAIQDSAGNDAVSLSATSVTNSVPVDVTAPVFSSASVPAEGTTLRLTYNELLSSTTAATSAFTVTVAGSPKTVSSVATSSSTVTLTLASPAVGLDQAVTVAYTDPTAGDDTNAIQDAAGNDAASLSATSVTNNSAQCWSGPTGGIHAVGDLGPGGGCVFYVASADFTSTGSACNTACKYLEAAPAGWGTSTTVDNACTSPGFATSDPFCRWSGNTSALIGASAQGTSVGTGYANTAAAVAQSGGGDTAGRAITAAWNYENNGVSDWHLPSKDELNELCKFARNQTTGTTATACNSTGSIRSGFITFTYISSSELDATRVHGVNFSNGSGNYPDKSGSEWFRPVRAFG